MNRRETIEFLRSHDNYLILNHRRPDGDAVGSAAALCLSLRQMGKSASVWKNPETLPRYQSFLTGLETEQEPENGTIVSVDLSTEQLLPLNGTRYAGRIRLCIDHHISNTGYAQNSIVDPESAACGEMLLEMLKELGPVTAEIANALYLAISTDTGCFQYANVTAATFRAAAELKALGADAYAINYVMFGTKSIARLRMEAALTESAQFYAHGKVCICCVTREMMDTLGADEEDVDDLASFPRSILGVEIGVLIKELNTGEAKISVRTTGGCNASEICAHLGGGGHFGAAGAQVDEGMEPAVKRILEAIHAYGVELS